MYKLMGFICAGALILDGVDVTGYHIFNDAKVSHLDYITTHMESFSMTKT